MNTPGPPTPSHAARIQDLGRILREAEKELQELAGGQVDSVADSSGIPFLLAEAQRQLMQSEAAHRLLAQQQISILNALPANIALVDADGVVVSVNEPWRKFARNNGLRDNHFALGTNYLNLCESATGECAEEARAVAIGLRAVLSGKEPSFQLDYPCHSPSERRWFRVMANPLGGPGEGVVITHLDITQRKLAELERQQLIGDLSRRMREMRALVQIARLLQEGEPASVPLLASVARLLPETARFPDSSSARVSFAAMESGPPPESSSSRIAACFKCSDGNVGEVEMFYPATQPPSGQDHFLKEEEDLLRAVADMLQAHFNLAAAIRALRSSEERLATSQSVARLGNWETNVSTLEVVWSGETHRIFETDPATFLPTHGKFLELVHPDDRSRVDGAFNLSLSDFKNHQIEHRIILPDGRVRHVEERWQAFPNSRGGPARVVGTCRDVTERKVWERRARETDERYRALFERSMDAVYVHDLQGRFLDANTAALNLLGYGREEIPRLDFPSILVRDEDLALAHAALMEQVAGREQELANEYQIKRKDGQILWVEVVSGVVFEEGVPVAIQGVARDVTARKRADEEVRQANQALEEILSSIHEIAGADLTSDATMGLMASKARDLLGGDSGAVLLVRGEELILASVVGRAVLAAGRRVPIEGSLCGLAMRRREGLLCEDAQNDPRACQDLCGEIGVRAMAASPLRDGNAVIGVILVMSSKPGTFAPRDLGNLQILTESLGAVIQRRRAMEQLRASEAHYKLLFTHNPHPMWVYDLDTLKFLMVNQAAIRHYGYSESEFLSMTLLDIRPREDVADLQARLATLGPGRSGASLWRHVLKDGTIVDVEISSDSLQVNGRQARLVLAQDVTEKLRSQRALAQANRNLTLLSSCNEALIRASSEQGLLDDVCGLAATIGGYRMAWVGYARDDERRSIEPMAHAGVDNGYLASAQLAWGDGQCEGLGPAGTAIRTGSITVCEDIHHDPSFAPWRQAACLRGYRGVICLPLMDGGKAFGLLGLYSAEVKPLLPDEAKLLRELADDLAFGILNLRSRAERQKLEAAVIKVGAGVSAASGMAFFAQLAASMAEALGASAGVVASILPGDPPKAKTLAAVLHGEVIGDFECDLASPPWDPLLSGQSFVAQKRPGEPIPIPPPLTHLNVECCVGKRLERSSGSLVGVVFVLFEQPLRQTEFVESTLSIFAARAASEIERLQDEERLREQAALLDIAREAIQVRTLDDTIILWNKGAEANYGWTAAEVAGRKSCDLFQQDEAKFNEAMETLIAKGEWRGEAVKRGKQGQMLTVEAGWTLVRDAKGHPKSILAIEADITEKKRLEARFLRAQRMESIGTLAGGIAHDLNNVLAPIMMSIEMLQDSVADPAGQAILSTIQTSARRGADLVRQVLSFARGVEGRRVSVDVTHLAKDLEKVIRDTFPKNVEFKLQRPSKLWVVEGDPTQIYQVLMNLCVNARDAMPNGGFLTMVLSNEHLDETYAAMHSECQPGAHLCVQVTDSGTGIPKEIQNKIFEPFFTTKDTGKGTGLGLSTSLGIVKSHGGFIVLESEPGKGATFKVYFPSKIGREAAQGEGKPTPELPRGNGETILVVDDEPAIREIVKGTLERYGYSVLLAMHGAEAVVIYATLGKNIAAVLTDMAMPVMDGHALVAALKAMNPKVRIIGSSGHSSAASLANTTHQGVDEFVPKPYTSETILNVLKKVLSQPV